MSQACRSLIWLLLNKKIKFELILTMPGSKQENGTRHPSYLEKIPNATIPALEDSDTGGCNSRGGGAASLSLIVLSAAPSVSYTHLTLPTKAKV